MASGRNYGYGPTKLRPAAIHNENLEKGLGGSGGTEEAGLAAAFGAWQQANASATHSVITTLFPTIYDSNTDLNLFLNALVGFYKSMMDDWNSKFSAKPSASPFAVVTPHGPSGPLATDIDSDKTDYLGWQLDASAASIGGIELLTIP